MNKFKTVLWILIFGMLMLIIFQNQEFFMERKSFGINLLIVKYKSPELPSAIIFLLFFLAGLVISYLFSLAERFRLKKTIKKLNATIDSQAKAIPPVKKEPGPAPPVEKKSDPVLTVEEESEPVLTVEEESDPVLTVESEPIPAREKGPDTH